MVIYLGIERNYSSGCDKCEKSPWIDIREAIGSPSTSERCRAVIRMRSFLRLCLKNRYASLSTIWHLAAPRVHLTRAVVTGKIRQIRVIVVASHVRLYHCGQSD